jgi:hypothetical protein
VTERLQIERNKLSGSVDGDRLRGDGEGGEARVDERLENGTVQPADLCANDGRPASPVAPFRRVCRGVREVPTNRPRVPEGPCPVQDDDRGPAGLRQFLR